MTFRAAPGLGQIDQGPCPSVHWCCPGFFRSPREVFSPAGGVRLYPFLRLAKTLPILMSVSATTPNPTHRSIPFLSPIAAAVEPVPSFEHADPALAPRPPFLPLAEPAFLLVLASCRAVGGTIRDGDPLHPQRVCLPFIFR